MTTTDDSTANRYYDAHGWRTIPAFFKNYVNFAGKTSRREFVWCLGLDLLLMTIMVTPGPAYFIGQEIAAIREDSTGGGGYVFIIVLAFLLALAAAMLVLGAPTMALFARRYRDAGVDWRLLVTLIIAYAIISGVLKALFYIWWAMVGFPLGFIVIATGLALLPTSATVRPWTRMDKYIQ